MGLSNATLNGNRVIEARVSMPAWGAWYADVVVDGEVTITGFVTLQIADLTLRGTILAGGPDKGRSPHRLVAGKAKWAHSVPKKNYADDGGVKVSKVLADAASACGETLDASTLPSTREGYAWTRPEGPAGHVLELLVPGNWYIGEDGVTRVGKRPTKAFTATAPRTTRIDKARGTVTLASETIASLIPGAVVDGLEAVDVEHTLSKDGLRTTIWGKRSTGTSRRLAAYRALLEQLDPGRAFRGTWEYRIVTQEGERLNLQPVRVSTGMPDLRRVIVRPGVAGTKHQAKLGSRVLVTFVDEDPSRPVVIAFEDAEGEGWKPLLTTIDATTFVKLADGARLMAATGDLAGGIFPVIGTTRVMG